MQAKPAGSLTRDDREVRMGALGLNLEAEVEPVCLQVVAGPRNHPKPSEANSFRGLSLSAPGRTAAYRYQNGTSPAG